MFATMPHKTKRAGHSPHGSSSSLPIALDINDFKGSFSFDELFKNLVSEALPSLPDAKSEETTTNGKNVDAGGKMAKPTFSEARKLVHLFKDARMELIQLSHQADLQLEKLKKEVASHDSRHQNKLSELEKGVQGLFESFSKLDSRISGVGQTAARIGDHLQSADAQRETASHTIEMIKYLMEFNSSPGDLMGLSPLFSDDSRVAEAAAVAQKLRSLAEEDIGGTATSTTVKGTANANPGLEVAVGNLQDYCNELENRLLDRFDAASHKKELSIMAECAKILSQFNRGARAMQRYVASRPMFIDVEIMNADARTVLGDQNPPSTTSLAAATTAPAVAAPPATSANAQSQASTSNIVRGLGVLYKEIIGTVRRESATISAVFPSPDAVMSILVQRVLEQRVAAVLDKILQKPALSNPTPVEEGGILQYLKLLAATYEKTQELARELRALGCGELDVEGLAESLFSTHRDDYIELERASLGQLFVAKMEEVKAAAQPPADIGVRGSKLAALASHTQQPMSASVVTEFIGWNDEAVIRCSMLTPQPLPLATNARAIFSCLLEQVSNYTVDGLERGQDSLREAASLRERFAIGSGVSRRVAAAAATAAEAAAAAGESSVRNFLVSVQRATGNVALVQQHFVSTIARWLLPVDGAHSACCEEMATVMSSAEGAALKGLQLCIDTVIAEVERLVAAEQKVPDYQPAEDGNLPDHRPTAACIRVVSYLARMLDIINSSLEGFNKQAFMTELGIRLYKSLLSHWQRFTFSPSGGLRLKRDVSELAEFVRNFKAPVVDEKFEVLGTMVNVFIVAPESLKTLVEGSLRNASQDAVKFIQLREDYKSAKISNILNTISV